MVTRKSLKRRTRRRNNKSTTDVVGYRPRVVVKFDDRVDLLYQDGIEKVIQELKLGPWEELSKKFPGITFKRVFTSLAPEEIRELIKRATEMDQDYKPVNLLAYFMVESPDGVDPEELAKALQSWPIVTTAYYDPPGGDPVVDPTDDDNFGFQGYLDPAGAGIDAEFAWGVAGGDGAGIKFIDMEQGWRLDHEDLSAHGATMPLHGVNLASSEPHGTAVLGVVCAVDNDRGCVGIVPNVASVNVVSYNGSNRPAAMLAAIARLSFGDVLLLEAHVDLPGWLEIPIEVLDLEFNTIRLATALGIVVVEAAGNGGGTGYDLDAYADAAGNRLLNRSFRDSGAIMVGAATSTPLPHTPLANSNFGSRIDCYGWGQNVESCNSTLAQPTTAYTNSFDGTSSASAIIAGAAVAVQGIAEARHMRRFSPKQLRVILSDPAHGTLSADPVGDLIGVMPNLRAISQNVLNVTTDVYIRDFVGDTGDPHTGPIAESPDIILRPTAVANPQTTFGELSGTENSNTLGYEAEAGQDNFIYVRVRNRGGSPATNVVARVYWSPPATLVTPDLWTLVGSVTIPNVPAGNVLTVSNAITWNAAAIPATGHYCLVGLVGTDREPPPERAALTDWANFHRFIRENNNVTWRNFNVVDNVPAVSGSSAGFVALTFLAPGAPDESRPMRLEIGAKLPEGSRLLLEAPRVFVDHMKVHAPLNGDERRGRVRLACNPHGREKFNEMVFPAKSRTKLKLLVQIPKEFRDNPYQVYARQLYEDQEVGRVTWRLVPPRFFEERDNRDRKMTKY